MSCCRASLRENTTTSAGRPASPSSSRRTSAWPSEPVPPVTTTRLSVSIRKLLHHLVPPRRLPSCRRAQTGAIEAAVDLHRRVRHELDLEPERVADEGEQIELRDWLGAHVPDAFELRVAFDQVANQAREHGRGRAAEHRAGIAARLAADAKEPLEQAARAVEL